MYLSSIKKHKHDKCDKIVIKMKTFIWMIKSFGLKVAIDNVLISLLKKYLKADRITITYKKRNRKP
jgi:hypothetical protein